MNKYKQLLTDGIAQGVPQQKHGYLISTSPKPYFFAKPYFLCAISSFAVFVKNACYMSITFFFLIVKIYGKFWSFKPFCRISSNCGFIYKIIFLKAPLESARNLEIIAHILKINAFLIDNFLAHAFSFNGSGIPSSPLQYPLCIYDGLN